MKKLNQFSKLSMIFLGAILLLTGLFSCKEEPIVKGPEPSAINLSPIDVTFLTQVKQSSDIYDMNEIWNGYDFSARPMYYVYVDTKGKAVRAYVINPQKEYEGAIKITGADALGLDLLRFDKDMDKAFSTIKSGNGLYDFNFKIEGADHYVQVYSDESVADLINPAITLAVHEIFHQYQFSDWEYSSTAIQEEENYPLTKELLEMQILLAKIAEKMPMETNTSEVKKYLEMYVAIRSKEMTLDPTAEKFVRNMANEQEKGEGIAKYIDNILGDKILTGFEITFLSPDSYPNYTTAEEVRSEFAFGIWYGTGAAVTHMLKNQGVALEEDIKKGKTLYDVAETELNLSDAQKSDALQRAKDEFDWAGIQALAEKLANF